MPLICRMSSQSSILRIDNISVIIEDKHILEVDSLNIPKGKITCVVGKSGAGKSTLLRSIVRLQASQSNIYWNTGETEVPITQITSSELRQKLCYLPQTPSMFPGSVFNNLQLAGKFKGISDPLANEIAQKQLQQVNLEEIDLEMRANSLSGGEKQRLALARTLVGNPEMVLLDEPTSSLDPITKKFFELQIKSLLELGLTLIIITHSITQMMNVADFILILHEGKLVRFAAIEEIFGPENERKEIMKNFDEAALLDKLTRGDFTWR